MKYLLITHFLMLIMSIAQGQTINPSLLLGEWQEYDNDIWFNSNVSPVDTTKNNFFISRTRYPIKVSFEPKGQGYCEGDFWHLHGVKHRTITWVLQGDTLNIGEEPIEGISMYGERKILTLNENYLVLYRSLTENDIELRFFVRASLSELELNKLPIFQDKKAMLHLFQAIGKKEKFILKYKNNK